MNGDTADFIYRTGLLIITGVGLVGGTITMSVRHHLGLKPGIEWIPAIIICSVVAGMAWPVMFLTPLVGLAYLIHKGLGLVVKPRLALPNTSHVDHDLADAEREVEEICSETPS